MPRLSDERLASELHARRSEAVCVPQESYAKTKPNDCHENARMYAQDYSGCVLICGWLIEQFVGWNYFIAHTVIERPDGSWVDPTPMRGAYPFLRHRGSDEDFAEQRLNRSQVSFVSHELTQEECVALLSELSEARQDCSR